jgi:hypothetical protein
MSAQYKHRLMTFVTPISCPQVAQMPKEELELDPPVAKGPKGKKPAVGRVAGAPVPGTPGATGTPGRGRPSSGAATVSSSVPNSMTVPTAATTGTTGPIPPMPPLGTQAPASVPGSTNTTTIAPPTAASLAGVTSMATHNSLPPQVVPPTTGYHAQPALDAQPTAAVAAPPQVSNVSPFSRIVLFMRVRRDWRPAHLEAFKCLSRELRRKPAFSLDAHKFKPINSAPCCSTESTCSYSAIHMLLFSYACVLGEVKCRDKSQLLNVPSLLGALLSLEHFSPIRLKL